MLTEYFLKKKINALVKQQLKTRERRYRMIDDVRDVLILCEVDDWKNVAPCIRALKNMKKTVHVCIFTCQQDNLPIWDYGFLPVDAAKDFTLWGFPKREIVDELNRMPSDMLIDLTFGRNLKMQYMMLQHPATFKVGAKSSTGGDGYDFSIVTGNDADDIPYFFNQAIHYLKMMRSQHIQQS